MAEDSRIESDIRKAYEGVQFDLGETFCCSGCDETSELRGWVAAHWHEDIVYTCRYCGTKTGLFEGQVSSAVPPEIPY